MQFDWREYLELAKNLACLKGSLSFLEAAYRTAVSQAYYAAFCGVRNCAAGRLGFKPTKTPNDHKLLREHLRRNGYVQLASDLHVLRQWRNACDYDDEVPNLLQQVSNSIKVADRIIRTCSF